MKIKTRLTENIGEIEYMENENTSIWKRILSLFRNVK